MAQQINLLTPILLAPRRYFSALAMAQGFGLLLLGFGLLAVWLNYQAALSRRSHEASLTQASAERQSLQTALAALPAPGDLKAMAQQASDLEQQLQRQRQLGDLLGSGVARDGARHSDLLQLLGKTIPPSVWIQELRWVSGRLELVGATLDTAALRSWLKRLSEQPQLAELQLSQVRVERWVPGTAATGAAAAGSANPPLLGSLSAPPAGVALWTFRVLSERPAVTPSGTPPVTPTTPPVAAVGAKP